MGRSSKEKGKRGEREFRDLLRGYFGDVAARRGASSIGEPDVVSGIFQNARIHPEIKRTEQFRFYEAIKQARKDALDWDWIVAHRYSKDRWTVTMDYEFFFRLITADFDG